MSRNAVVNFRVSQCEMCLDVVMNTLTVSNNMFSGQIVKCFFAAVKQNRGKQEPTVTIG